MLLLSIDSKKLYHYRLAYMVKTFKDKVCQTFTAASYGQAVYRESACINVCMHLLVYIFKLMGNDYNSLSKKFLEMFSKNQSEQSI